MARYIDRSRVLAYQRCPRERLLGYELEGRGIRSARLSVPTATGGHIHAGLAELLLGKPVDTAVATATDAYRAEAEAALTAMSTHVDHHDYVVAEQAALTEALVRVYALRGLPALLEEYEVLEVEQEYEAELAPGLTFMARLDGLLRKRSDGGLYVLSFKTDSGSGLIDKIEEARVDLQGLSEPWALERSAARWRENQTTEVGPPWWRRWNMEHNPAEEDEVLQVAGVKMEWLVKGSWQEEVKGSGLKYQNSHLVRPWRHADSGAFAWRYYWPCPGHPHEIMKKGSSKPWICKGKQAQHGLGDSWERVAIWEHMPVKEWIERLEDISHNEVWSGENYAAASPAANPFEGCLYLPVPIYRNAIHMEDRMEQAAVQEGWVAVGAKMWSEIQHRNILNAQFPQYTSACNHHFGGACPYKPLCFHTEPMWALTHWAELGFVPRTPHHAPELVQIQGGKG